MITASPSEYTIDYSIPSGDEDTSKCGFYTLSAFLLIEGGLEGRYFANRWFSGKPYLTRPDAVINFNWGTGEIITDVASNYVSVEWVGFLKPAFTESYTFEFHADDGVRLWINEKLVIDHFVDVSDENDAHRVTSEGFTIDLTADIYVPIKIEYYDAVGAAHVQLYWQSASQAFEIIPTTALFYKRSHTPLTGSSSIVEGYFTPRRPTGLYQGDELTFAADEITLHWTAPQDDGC